MENWKPIVGYEHLYAISDKGRVKSLKKDKILKLKTNRGGYLCACLSKNGSAKYYSVHRLVAIHFIENPENYPCVNHKDENKKNNNVGNLEWCTHQYNVMYGTSRERGAIKRKQKIIMLKDNIIIREFDSAVDAYNVSGFCVSSISLCCNGKQNNHKGYEFKFKNN